jgi:nitroimidazol reductase NimA-like FMN-containing flavoprotein (pyridoxamine 5'-phosphate oxidase superfamily)
MRRPSVARRARWKKFFWGSYARLLSKGVLLMNEPVTNIDPRYSDPNAVATPWNETRRALEEAELFWMSTVRADGRPHVTPLVAVWLDGALHFSTGATEQKTINLRGNPHVILTTGCNDWEKGLDVVVEGDAVQITDDDMLERLAIAWATKWDFTTKVMGWPSCSRSSPPRSSRSARAPSATHVTSSD